MKKLITILSLLILLAGASAFTNEILVVENVENVESSEIPSIPEEKPKEEPFWRTTTLNGQQIWYTSDFNFRNYVVPVLNTYMSWVTAAQECAQDYEVVGNQLNEANNTIAGLETWRTVLGVTSIFLILGNIGGLLLW